MNEKSCHCPIHAYPVFHIYKGRIYNHSQSDWDSILRYANPDEIITLDSSEYKHDFRYDQKQPFASLLCI